MRKNVRSVAGKDNLKIDLKPIGNKIAKLSGGGGGDELANVVIRGCAIILGTFWGCSRIFGYLSGLFPDFWVSFFCDIFFV